MQENYASRSKRLIVFVISQRWIWKKISDPAILQISSPVKFWFRQKTFRFSVSKISLKSQKRCNEFWKKYTRGMSIKFDFGFLNFNSSLDPLKEVKEILMQNNKLSGHRFVHINRSKLVKYTFII